MEREIISRENIKPCSPTPPHLKSHNLSLLDQITAPSFFPLVLYFSTPHDNLINNTDEVISQTIHSLKLSLASTLTRFYPLAGRIKDRLSIDCNDEGAMFVVAKFRGNLSDFLKEPRKTESRLLIACELDWKEQAPGTHVLLIQLNCFDCGGIAIGTLFWHKATDGVTISTFMKAWATSACGVAETEYPNYTAGSLFPQNKQMQRESSLFFSMTKYMKIGRPGTRRYVFDSSTLSRLRAELTESGGIGFRPTRVEIVSALLWKCFMVALSSDQSSAPKSLATHSINIRRKVAPCFPEQSFGNFVWLAPVLSANTIDVDLKHLIRAMRAAISKIDNNFVRRMQGDDGFSGYCRNVKETLNECLQNAEYLGISSWCNFGLYKFVDFGWGKPLWITGCNGENDDTECPLFNLVWLVDTREGDGIEAWVIIDEKHFAAFESVTELQALASFDPSPFEYGTIIQ